MKGLIVGVSNHSGACDFPASRIVGKLSFTSSVWMSWAQPDCSHLPLYALCLKTKERNFMAIMIAGASGLSEGSVLASGSFVFTTIVTWFAYKGLQIPRFHWRWLDITDTGGDILHHLYGIPIVPVARNFFRWAAQFG